jgi:hypothetical protein
LTERNAGRDSPLLVLLAVAAMSLAVGCATGNGPGAAAQGADAKPPIALEERRTESHTFRIGFWELDFLALDLEPRGATFRILDFKILKALEIGWGDDYHSFSVVEMPDLLNVLTTRHEGPIYEHRLADLQALALAVLRLDQDSARESEMHLLKVPVIGSIYGQETDGPKETHKVLYLFAWDRDR